MDDKLWIIRETSQQQVASLQGVRSSWRIKFCVVAPNIFASKKKAKILGATTQIFKKKNKNFKKI